MFVYNTANKGRTVLLELWSLKAVLSNHLALVWNFLFTVPLWKARGYVLFYRLCPLSAQDL